jgi:hypothetical protein
VRVPGTPAASETCSSNSERNPSFGRTIVECWVADRQGLRRGARVGRTAFAEGPAASPLLMPAASRARPYVLENEVDLHAVDARSDGPRLNRCVSPRFGGGAVHCGPGSGAGSGSRAFRVSTTQGEGSPRRFLRADERRLGDLAVGSTLVFPGRSELGDASFGNLSARGGSPRRQPDRPSSSRRSGAPSPGAARRPIEDPRAPARACRSCHALLLQFAARVIPARSRFRACSNASSATQLAPPARGSTSAAGRSPLGGGDERSRPRQSLFRSRGGGLGPRAPRSGRGSRPRPLQVTRGRGGLPHDPVGPVRRAAR